jgi:MoCo/4Fe-4S cofactor protein with predicted Tat translocation signal
MTTDGLQIEALAPTEGPNARTADARQAGAETPDGGASSRKHLDLPQLRKTLAGRSGQQYWRSLDELADSAEFQQLLHREFPENASEWSDGTSRRTFLKLMGASLAFGGLTGCTIQPEEKIVPWVRAPENMLPGKPLYYATAAAVGGVGVGLLVESHMGRPTKIEGNPSHPGSLGATHPSVQASVLDLYDPDRSQTVKNAGRISTWGGFVEGVAPALSAVQAVKGEGLRILTGSVSSPTMGAQIQGILEALPAARWHQFDAARGDGAEAGAQMAFGRSVNTYFDLSEADVVLSLDADLFMEGPAAMRYARQFMGRRTAALHEGDDATVPNRLYVAETTPSSTGSIADHRLGLDSGSIEALAATVAARLGVDVDDVPAYDDTHGWVDALVEDLRAHAGRSVVAAGAQQAGVVHALAHAINAKLGNIGSTVHLTAPIDATPTEHAASLRELAADMHAGKVSLLVVIGANPLYDAPAELDLAGAFDKVGTRVHVGSHEDETSQQSHWHVPQSHYLESWSDLRAYDGSVTIVQPLIRPLYPTRSAHEVLAVLAGNSGKPILDVIKDHWAADPLFASDTSFEATWQKALHDGLLPGTALPAITPRVRRLRLPAGTGVVLDPEEGVELALRPDPYLGAGASANNGWLQETPRPVHKLTWDNAAIVSPATAERLGVTNEQVVTLGTAGGRVDAPIWIVPGQADGVITTHLGFGRTRGGRVANGVGFNAAAVRSADGAWATREATVVKTFERHALACTQDHQSIEGRDLVRLGDIDHYRSNPRFVFEDYREEFPEELSLYGEHDYSAPNQWGMAIDLSACMGCNACAIACQSENNIPIVGKDEVLNAREMAWIRVDRYFSDLDDPEILHQPVPCQQCENAPCEVVCPVTATVHSSEGLNDMVYNRCVGTRYCSNNCPYKVRRFNFLQYTDRETESLKMARNPDVSTRARGIMEKCTYCVQRLNAARVEAKVANGEGRVGGDAVQSACQQACPTGAISFGNLTDANSQVSRRKKSPLNYGILTDLNTKPRTSYLARVKNPNPKIG